MNKETMIAIPADPNDPEDRDVSVAGLERAHMGRFIRVLRYDLGMTQDFAQRATVTTADNRDLFRLGVGRQYRMRHHLVVEEVVAGAHHGAAIDHHEITPSLGLVDFDVLKRGLLGVNAAPLKRERARGGLVDFGKPLVCV